MTIVFKVIDSTGDTRTQFSSIEEANKRFKQLTGSGFLAYEPGKNGEPGKVLKNLDETVEETIFRPRLIGG